MLLNLSLQIRASLAQRRNSGAKNLAEAAKQYIQANYQNPDLSVETICSELHISQSYFSNLFKQETGKSCIQYLTSVRMDRAVELLRTTDDRTYLVAQKVGYDDANYFSYVFKKQFGISPTQFREVIHMAKKLTDRVEAWRGRASIRYTMFLSFTASAIIAVFLTGITLYLRFSSQLNTAIQAENQMVMEQVEQSLSTYLRDMLGLADSCSYNVVKGRNVQNEDLTGELMLLYDTYSEYVDSIAVFDPQREFGGHGAGRVVEQRRYASRGTMVFLRCGKAGKSPFLPASGAACFFQRWELPMGGASVFGCGAHPGKKHPDRRPVDPATLQCSDRAL